MGATVLSGTELVGEITEIVGHDVEFVGGMQKERNLRRDPRIAVNVADPDDVARFFEVRGRVLSMTSEGGKEGIDALSQKYLGIPYPYFSGNPDETRLVVTIEADKVNTPMRG
jgi:hypothetical protein